MERKTCGYKGDKKKWDEFMKIVKSKRLYAHEVIEPFIDEYIENNKQ